MENSKSRFNYPAPEMKGLVEDYHGTRVADPYRWFEDIGTPEVSAFVEAENKITNAYLKEFEGRNKIENRLKELWDYPRFSVPSKEGDFYFFNKIDGLQNQPVLFRQKDLKSQPEIVLDPNELSADGTIALTTQAFNREGNLLAYGTSGSGSDWQEVRIRDLNTGKDFPEVLKWCKFTGIAWKDDSSGFFYSRYPEKGTVTPEDTYNFNKVFWHELGTPQDKDRLVYERPDAKELAFSPQISEDGRYLILRVWRGTEPKNRVYYREVENEGDFVRLLEEADASYNFVGNQGSIFYFETDFKAPNYRVVAIDLARPEKAAWKEIIPEQKDVLAFVGLVSNRFVAVYTYNVHHQVKLYRQDGSFDRDQPLPAPGTITGMTGKQKDQEMFLSFASFLFPTTLFRCDFTTRQLTLFKASETKFNPEGYETTQVFYPSKDGTLVPMFITHKKGLKRDGSNPTLLYGYGGFDISLMPDFSVQKLFWLEQGGIYAVANLRGGGEFGENWHTGGMLEKKQNVFDDFISAGEWLIKNNYTSTPKLAIEGRSNGGLLVAACMTQRPDLFGAVICGVPVIDMLRFHTYTVGRYWTGEYGNAAENPDHFKFMYAYSPLHNIKEGVEYPPTIITTADTDDRVLPAHAYKFAATLQRVYKGNNPVLLRVETKAGHGMGKPTTKVIEELADLYAFLFKELGVKF